MTEIEKKLFELNEAELVQIYKNVFNSDGGKLLLEDLRNRFFAKWSTVGLEGIDPNLVLYNEGMRAVLLHIESQLRFEKQEEIQQESARPPGRSLE